MSNFQDPYQVLGVSKTATQDEIKNAYRNLAKKYHPDLNPGNSTAEKNFKDVSIAYEMIGTEENRSKYERGEFEQPQARNQAHQRQRPYYYQTQQRSHHPGGRYTFSFGEGMDEDLFESLFGSHLRGFRTEEQSSKRGPSSFDFSQTENKPTQLYRVEITLRDATLGAEKEISLPSGKRLRLVIPKGVKTGTQLRIKPTSKKKQDQSSDIFIELQVQPDERFQIANDDLLFELPIPMTQAVFGGEIRIPTLEGHVLLKIPPHSNTGTRLRLSGKGLYSRSTGHRGDQIVSLKVLLPEKIDPELEAALKQWKERHHGTNESEAA